GHSGYPIALAVTADGRMLASVDWGGEILVWDLAKGTEFASLRSEDDSFTSIACTADGKTLVTGESNGAVRLWDVGQLRRRCEQVRTWMKALPGVSDKEAAA